MLEMTEMTPKEDTEAAHIIEEILEINPRANAETLLDMSIVELRDTLETEKYFKTNNMR